MRRLTVILLGVAMVGAVPHQARQFEADVLRGVLSVTSVDREDGAPVPVQVALIQGSGDEIPLRFNAPQLLTSAIAAGTREVEILGAKSRSSDDLAVSAINVLEPNVSAVSATAPQGNLRYLTLLCRFGDRPSVTPQPVSYYQSLSGTGLPSFDHYYREVSENRISMNDSSVAGWFDLPDPSSVLVPSGNFNMRKLTDACSAAADPTVYFPDYAGINFVFNGVIGSGYGGAGTTGISVTADGQTRIYRATYLGQGSSTCVFFHEMGHTLGLLHSSGPYTATYDSRWSPMSGGCFGGRLPDPLGSGTLPMHYLAYEKSLLGWIPPSREYVVAAGETRTLTLERHANPATIDGLLYIRIPVTSNPGRFYTVEARLFNGYDGSVVDEAVVMHDVLPSRGDRAAQVVDPDGNGNPNDAGAAWVPGETFTDAVNNISVSVNSRTSTGFTVTVQRGAGSDSTPPTISGILPLYLSPITSLLLNLAASAVHVVWTTNEGSDTQVEYGTTKAYGLITTLDSSSVTSHNAFLSGLSQATTYHYRVLSRDTAGNLAVSSDQTFVTDFSIGFSIPNLGGVSRVTSPGSSLEVGYGLIRPADEIPGSTTPSGLAIFGYSQGGVLVTEAGVPDAPLITRGRIYAEVSADGTVNTGLAIANPNQTSATISFEFRNAAGTIIRNGSFVLTGTNTACTPSQTQVCNHLSRFLNESPYLGGTGIQGTLTFTSTALVAAIALRGIQNERTPSEFLITTLPVLDLDAGTTTGTQTIPHFAVGGGWTTQVLLVNPTAGTLTGTLQFRAGSGLASSVRINGQTGTNGSYSVAAQSSAKYVITGSMPDLASGTIRVVPSGNGAVPKPLVIFSYKPTTITVSEAGVPVTMGQSFRTYAELIPSQRIRSGLAIANATDTAGNFVVSVTGLDGSTIATSDSIPLPASGQVVQFLDETIPALVGQTVRGIVRVSTSDLSSISVIGLRLRYNERGDFLMTTTPPTIETDTPSSAYRLFPHLATGGGFAMQFILFSGSSGQIPAGTLSFVKASGAPFGLNIQ